MKAAALAACVLIAWGGVSSAQAPAQQVFSPDLVQKGAALYAKNCASCHGRRMANPDWAIDLRTFPKDEHSRFVNSVTNGKNSMPPWGGLFSAEEIEALWSYVMAGEKK